MWPSSKKYPNCSKGHQYALDVVEGSIPSCKYVIGACNRYLKDLELGKYPFNLDAAERFLRLVQKFEHHKGKWTTKNIRYEPWQCFLGMNIMGFYNPVTKFRRYRSAHIEVPRGAGKSVIASQFGLYFMALDAPNGNEVDCVATKMEQARIVLDSARAMARKNDSFLKATGVKVLAHKIIHPKSNSSMQALSSDHSGMDGRASVLSIMDELHAMKRETFDVIYSGMSKRRDSLTLCITTAGFSLENIGYSQSKYAKRVAIGEIEDEQFFSLIYTIDEGDNIFEEKTWRKANPNFGVSVDPITFEAKANKARQVPSDLANFKVKHLNMWLSEMNAFFDVAKLKRCADPSIKIEDFKGMPVRIGLDVASHIDLTSIAYVFKKDDRYYIFDRSYIPEDTVSKVKSTMYDNCIGNGYLISTKGAAIDQTQIENRILEDQNTFKIIDCMFDPWSSLQLSQNLAKKRVNMVQFRMTTANLSEPTKALDALIRSGKIVYNGSPLLEWCFGNVVCKHDPAGNVFPRKENEKLKIDPVIAIIMALAGWLQDETSVYESRGLIIL